MKRTRQHNRKISLAMKGKKKTEAHKAAIGRANKKWLSDPKANPNYRGDAIGYGGIHDWLRKTFGPAKYCEFCGIKGEKINNRWTIVHALRQGLNYERKRENFIMLCNSCHVSYDRIQERSWKTRRSKIKAYEEIFAWLLGEKGDFPDLSKKPHYSFRTELRERLRVISKNK